MRLKKVLTLALIAACGTAESKKTEQVMTQEKATYQKKYTNADFYKDGKFDQEAAKEAFLDMFKFYGVPYTPLMEKDIWFTDFGLGDFENVGMGGIFWVNDSEYGYFAHAIYLLPGQMIPEHAHVKTAFPAKHESWMVNHGWVYNFSEVGDETPNAPAVPASHGPIKSTVGVFVEFYSRPGESRGNRVFGEGYQRYSHQVQCRRYCVRRLLLPLRRH